MIQIRPSQERGHANHGWLNSRFSFSFADYYDPKHMHFRTLRVINDDYVAPGKGFGMHPHRDMEIVTWVVEGQLEHADSMGNKRVILPGELQAMSAGSGLMHSEYNPSQTEAVHLFQMWIMPAKKGITPRYDQTLFPLEGRQGKFQTLAAPDTLSEEARGLSLPLNQDAYLLVANLAAGQQTAHSLGEKRGAWVQVTKGSITLNGNTLNEGDGAAIEEEALLSFSAHQDSQVLLFDLG